MKDLLSFSKSEKRTLKIGLLVLGVILFLTNIKPAYQGIAQLPIWQPKGRPAERSPNFKPPETYQGVWNDLGTTRFVTLDVLVLIYKRIGDGELSQDEVGEIRQGVNLTREFFWRNSDLQLNINPAFLEVEDVMSNEFLDEEGKIWPKSGLLEEYLLERGIKKNQYDCVFLFYPSFATPLRQSFGGQEATGDSASLRPGNGVSGSGMKLKRLGKAAYSFASLPAAGTDIVYPDGPRLTWVFASQLWYSINSTIYNHDSEEIEDWNTLATTLRNYPVQDPPKPYGKIYRTVDYDRDGVADEDALVPFCESSLGLNRETSDSDNDGLEDHKELTAGIFRSTDLFLIDTDGDGLKDGSDPYPLDPNLPAEVPSDD